jgi:hypothetical protein
VKIQGTSDLETEMRGVARSETAAPADAALPSVDAKQTALRATLDASIALAGEVTDAEIDAAIVAKRAELRRWHRA